ncbi:RNA polymerase sigma-70 factor (ECF subfamily) [Sphingobium sp. OAS761]|uniref:RNA polymerase sigma factor n=1 Tax=Sphingobium sp. OAS761 TaxID=2817901 RepID=UPI0020A0DB7F|nr:RNA polymerase sigma factor [Sphingobium sp. OAS761]MCP1469675.1 RNA polymerase sigma-70 factor (ECF subfamily) [Sphingobium sp. OAS761]
MLTNAASLTRLLIDERPSLLRLARRIVGSEAVAEDVAQSLWLKVQQIADHPPIANKHAYLFRLARNLAADHAKADRRRAALFEAGPLPEELADGSPLAERQLLDREALLLVEAAVAELSPRCREILHLRRIEGLPASEIALRLGISRQMVTRYIAQAMEHCLDRLEPGA